MKRVNPLAVERSSLMVQFMQATYQNSQLILKEKLNEALEGKTVNIIVISEDM